MGAKKDKKKEAEKLKKKVLAKKEAEKKEKAKAKKKEKLKKEKAKKKEKEKLKKEKAKKKTKQAKKKAKKSKFQKTPKTIKTKIVESSTETSTDLVKSTDFIAREAVSMLRIFESVEAVKAFVKGEIRITVLKESERVMNRLSE